MSIFLHAPFQIYLRTVCYPYCRLIKALTSSCISLPDAKTKLFLWNSILNVSSSYSMHQWTSFLISFLLHFQECYIQSLYFYGSVILLRNIFTNASYLGTEKTIPSNLARLLGNIVVQSIKKLPLTARDVGNPLLLDAEVFLLQLRMHMTVLYQSLAFLAYAEYDILLCFEIRLKY